MKKFYALQLFTLILITGFFLESCSYTQRTGSSKAFGKKHYNRGIVKHKGPKKEYSSINLVKSEDLEDKKLSKKEKKEKVKEKVITLLESKNLSASNTEETVTYDSNAAKELISDNFSKAKEKLYLKKENATKEKEKRKIDRKLNRIERFENILNRFSKKLNDRIDAAGTPSYNKTNADTGLIGLLAGVFGIIGFVFSFIPFINFLGLLLCVSAIVLGAIGLKGDNKGWAIAGLVLGILGLLFFVLAIAVFFALL